MDKFSDLITLGGIIIAMLGSVGSLAWFIAGQFTNVRKLIHETIERTENVLLNKIEYHERHDDQRFSAITRDLWDVRVRNAARDGISTPEPRN